MIAGNPPPPPSSTPPPSPAPSRAPRARLGRDVLRDEAMLAALVGALSDVERLVLLGDTVELLEGRPRLAMAGAGPVPRAVGPPPGAAREGGGGAGQHPP